MKQRLGYMLRGFWLLKRLFPGYFALEGLAAAARAVSPVVILYASSRIVDELVGEQSLLRIGSFAALAILTGLLSHLLTIGVERHNMPYFSMSIPILAQDRAIRISDICYEYIENARVSELLADIEGREQGAGQGLQKLLRLIPDIIEGCFGLLAALGLFISALTSPRIILSGWLVSPFAAGLLYLSILIPPALKLWLSRRERKTDSEIFSKVAEQNKVLGYCFAYTDQDKAAKDIRIYAQQETVMDIAFHKDSKFSLNRLFVLLLQRRSENKAIAAAGSAFSTVYAYLLIGLRTLGGMYTIGQATRLIGVISQLADRLLSLMDALSQLSLNNHHLESVMALMDLPKEETPGTIPLATDTYTIQCHDLWFSYPGSDSYALQGLNLTIAAGERLAIIGKNGSGKTTLIKLLCRLYKPSKGYITLGGINIQDYAYKDYMQALAVVFQDSELFSFSLAQNVSASLAGDEARVRAALDEMGLRLPPDSMLYKQYDDSGLTPSGGELQKIAAARALYKNAPVLILDEPTAALDPEAEYELYRKLAVIAAGKTAVYISHRLSSCRFCDKVAVLDSGRLVQHGSHAVLLGDDGGLYYELWHAQAQYYT